MADHQHDRPPGAARMPYAHVNVWRLNDAGASWDDTSARRIAAALSRQRGFQSYTLVRTGEWEVVAVTVFDSRRELDDALKAVARLVREAVWPLSAGAPDRREGVVLMHVAA